MDLDADIKWVVKELQQIKDPAFIEVIKDILKNRKYKMQSDRISIEQYNKEIEEAEKDIEAGNFYTLEEVRKLSEKWGRK